MKKILPVLVLAGLLVFPAIALGQDPNCGAFHGDEDGCRTAGYPCQWNPATQQCFEVTITSVQDILNFIDNIVWWVFAFVMAVALIFLFLSGYNFITAGGDEAKIKSARSMLIYALVGVAVAIGARALIMIVQVILGS